MKNKHNFCFIIQFLGTLGLLLAGILKANYYFIALAIIVFVFFSMLELYYEKKENLFICPACGKTFKADWRAILSGWHKNNTHLMTCPQCGKKGWMSNTEQ